MSTGSQRVLSACHWVLGHIAAASAMYFMMRTHVVQHVLSLCVIFAGSWQAIWDCMACVAACSAKSDLKMCYAVLRLVVSCLKQ